MEKGRIAIPSVETGGLDGKRSGHFGHCDTFTLVDVKDGTIEKVSTIDNQSHVQGGCRVPVNLLAENEVNALIVGVSACDRSWDSVRQASMSTTTISGRISVRWWKISSPGIWP